MTPHRSLRRSTQQLNRFEIKIWVPASGRHSTDALGYHSQEQPQRLSSDRDGFRPALGFPNLSPSFSPIFAL